MAGHLVGYANLVGRDGLVKVRAVIALGRPSTPHGRAL